MSRKTLILIISSSLSLFFITFSLAADPTPDPATTEKNIAEFMSNICSGHGGVNCSAIRPDGAVVCNDGTIDTSRIIYAVPECHEEIEAEVAKQSQIILDSGCFPPSEMLCINSQSYSKLFKILSDLKIQNSELGKRELSQCQDQIKDYQSKAAGYEQCLQATGNNKIDFSLSRAGLPILKTIFCPLFYGPNSSYNESADMCLCSSGYFMQNGQCTPADQICKDLYGVNTYAGGGNCYTIKTPAIGTTIAIPSRTPVQTKILTPLNTPLSSPIPTENYFYPDNSASPEPSYIYTPPVSQPGLFNKILNKVVSLFKNVSKIF